MPQHGPEQREQLQQQITLRDRLRLEANADMAFLTVAEDSDSYEYAAVAVKALLERGLRAADSVARVLQEDVGLPDDDDPKKIPVEERGRYEAMLTEVETWTITLPALLRKARVVQWTPAVQETLQDCFDIIVNREEFLQSVEQMRFIVLKGSTLNPHSPFERQVPPEFYTLASIATTAWMLRQRLGIHPALTAPGHDAERDAYLRTALQLSDEEVEGGWNVEDSSQLDEFLLRNLSPRFKRDVPRQQEERRKAFQEFFLQDRVKVNGQVTRDPKMRVVKGDRVTVTTVFSAQTLAVAERIEQSRKLTDEERRRLNAERVTQGFPGAESFAYSPEGSLSIWRRLLAIGGPAEQARYRKQLAGIVHDFSENFIEGRAFDEFKAMALKEKEAMQADNARAKRFIEFILAISGKTFTEGAAERFTTTPEEFDQVFDEVMAKIAEERAAFATPERIQAIEDLLHILKSDKPIDQENLDAAIQRFSDVFSAAGTMITAIQEWQIDENIQRVGGLGKPNNLDLVTRQNNKSTLHILRRLVPYNARAPLVMHDEEGRLILLPPPSSFSQYGIIGHGIEVGKLGLETAAASIVLAHLAVRVPILGRTLGQLGIPVALAEAQLALAKSMALQERAVIATKTIEESVETLLDLAKKYRTARDKNPEALDDLNRETVRIAGLVSEEIHKQLVILLTIAEGEEHDSNRVDLGVESAFYTNQLLSAFDLPPCIAIRSDMKSTMMQASQDSISPELRAYVDVLRNEEALEKDDRTAQTRRELDMLRKTIEGKNPLEQESPEKPPRDPIAAVLEDGALPSTLFDKRSAYNKLVEVRKNKQFGTSEKGVLHDTLRDFGEMEKEQTLAAYELAGEVYRCLRQMHRLEVKFGTYDKVPVKERDSLDKETTQLASLSVPKLLAAAYLLNKNPPTTEQIAEVWFQESLPGAVGAFFSGNAVEKRIHAEFGKPGKRDWLDSKLLEDWTVLWDYNRLLREKKR